MADQDLDLQIRIGTQGVNNFAGMLKNMAAHSAQLATNIRALSSYTIHSATSFRTLTESGQRAERDAYRKKFEVGSSNIPAPAGPGLGVRMGEWWQELNGKLLEVARSAGILTATLSGLAFAGIRASSAGQVISFEWEKLSRAIAGLFGPEINRFIEGLRSAQRWINGLTDAQKGLLASSLLVVGTLAAVSTGLLLLNAGLTLLSKHPIITMLSVAGAAAAGFSQFRYYRTPGELPQEQKPGQPPAPPSRWRFDIGGKLQGDRVQAGLRAGPLDVGVGSEPDTSGRGSLPRRVGGIEALEATWERIAAASVTVGAGAVVDVPTEQLKELQKITTNTDRAANRLEAGQEPPAVRRPG